MPQAKDFVIQVASGFFQYVRGGEPVFKIGEFVVYGHSGVCRVASIDYPELSFHVGDKKLYYKLEPVCSTEVIYTPVDTKVQMRPVISCEQARQLLDRVREDGMSPADVRSNMQDEYDALLKNQECTDLLWIIKSIQYKKRDSHQSGKKLTATEQKTLKQAEELLSSELAVVLDKDLEATKLIIDDVVTEWLARVYV